MLFVYESDLNAKYIHNGNRKGLAMRREKNTHSKWVWGWVSRMENRQSLAHQKMFGVQMVKCDTCG